MRMDAVVPVRLASVGSGEEFALFRLMGGHYLWPRELGDAYPDIVNAHRLLWDANRNGWGYTDSDTGRHKVRGYFLNGFIFSGGYFVAVKTTSGWEALGGQQTVHGFLSAPLKRRYISSFVVWDFQGKVTLISNTAGSSTGVSMQIHDAGFLKYPDNDDTLPAGTRVLASWMNYNWVLVGYDCYISGHG